MNKEIKVILDKLKNNADKHLSNPLNNCKEYQDYVLYDYITNLQQRSVDIGEYNTLVNKYNEIYKENKNLKSQLKGTTHCYDEEEHKKLQQENERLKDNQLKALNMLIVVYGGNDEYYVKTILKARNILQNGSDSQ